MVLSGRAEENCKVEALDLGAYDYVTKPFGMNELLARIRAACRHKLQVDGERPVFRSGATVVGMIGRVELQSTGWLRAAVLGANDGILSTASLVLNVPLAASVTGCCKLQRCERSHEISFRGMACQRA